MKIPFLGPKADPLAIPAYKTTPAGKRAGLVTVANVTWELIDHAPLQNLTLRHLGDRDCVGPVFILTRDDVTQWVLKHGQLLGLKKFKALCDGFHLDGWEPGTFVMAQDPGAKEDYYGGHLDELVSFLTTQLTAAMEVPQPATDAPHTAPTNGLVDGA